MLLLLAMPVIQLIIFGFAISTEIKNTPFGVLDESKSVTSTQLIDEVNASRYFSLQKNFSTIQELEKAFQNGSIKMGMVIAPDFSIDLQKTGTANIQVLTDASDPNEASTVTSYVQQITAQYQQRLLNGNDIPYLIHTEVKMLYNPQMESAYNFVPGIMGLVLMLVCAMMTSIAIVREKEQGTMEILLVSSAKPMFIVLAKAIPYLCIAMLDVVGILMLSVFVLGVPIAGSLPLLLLLCFVFTLSALSLGLLISSITNSQQAAMLISGIGLMLPTMLLSGMVFPLENMPWLLQTIANAIPAKWFIMAIKDVMIKGLGIGYIYKELLILSGMTLVLLVASIKRFRNRL